MVVKARVIKSTGSWYQLKLANGELILARIKGKLKLLENKSTNPIAVGDWVEAELESSSEHYTISKVLPRQNYIIRKSNNLSKQTQIIASNMDLACIVVSAVAPVTSTGFIDRFLVTAEAYHLPVLIIYNKVDIYGLDIYYEMSSVYAKIGYQTMAVSAKEYIGIDALKNFLKNKTTLFTGHSGVGKSSLLNILIPGTERKVGEISDSTMMGKHTTTFAEMFDMPDGGSIIDTPGIRDLGVIDIDKKELAHYFPEMRKLMNECKFNNCIHVNEPQCAVLKAVNDGVLDPGRYYNYLSILRNEDVMG